MGHLVSVPGHKTSGGLTIEEVEAHFQAKLGDMTTFDSFMDYNVVFATNSLQSYKTAFDQDKVKYLVGIWSDSQSNQYSSIIVQVPGSQLILELVQKASLTFTEEQVPIELEQRVPDSVLAEQESRFATKNAVLDTTGDYIVSLVVNRAASSKAMSRLDEFYVTGMGTTRTHDATENGATKKCFLWPGATVNICFTNRADNATLTDFKVGDFEDMLNNVHSTIIDGHSWCPMDRWFDNHYAIDSRSVDNTKILNYINSKKPFHTCGNNPMRGTGLSAVFDPTGLGTQMDTGTGLPNDCNTFATSFNASDNGHSNPACTVDTSKCGSLTAVLV